MAEHDELDRSKLFRVKKTGLLVGGKVYREGDVFGYRQLTQRTRDDVYARLSSGSFDGVEAVSGGDNLLPTEPETEAPEQPQGDADDKPLDPEKMKAAVEAKNVETSGAVEAKNVETAKPEAKTTKKADEKS